MVIPRWLRSKLVGEPTMKDLRDKIRQDQAEISEHSTVIIEKVQARKLGRTVEINPPVTNGSH